MYYENLIEVKHLLNIKEKEKIFDSKSVAEAIGIPYRLGSCVFERSSAVDVYTLGFVGRCVLLKDNYHPIKCIDLFFDEDVNKPSLGLFIRYSERFTDDFNNVAVSQYKMSNEERLSVKEKSEEHFKRVFSDLIRKARNFIMEKELGV